MLDDVLKTIEARQHQSLSALKQFLSIPSVSTKPEHKPDILRCATWLVDQFKFAELTASVMQTPGHPIVVAKNKHVRGRPTVLVYGHYDVQPPEPLDLWTTPPFEPTVRTDENGYDAIHARGTADDKGQVWCHIEAAMACQAHGGLPVNVTYLIEGEEEIGSDHLEAFVQHYADDLRADVCVVSDTNQFARGLPAITYGLRGLAYAEIILTGPLHDLHSGLYGGAVPNPANVLCEIVASLHTPDGRVHIPGFYDHVVNLTSAERAMWAKLPFTETAFAESAGISHGSGEVGYTSLERKWARPTLDVNGITTGYQGPGAKTVIPSKASAKISMRLVPDQNPEKIQAAFDRVVRERLPKNCTVDIRWFGASAPVLIPIDGQATQLAASALRTGFGTEPTFMREGGSIPVVGLLKKLLNLDTLLIGFGLPDDRVHSPNEKFDLDALHQGTRTCAALYDQLAKMNTRKK